MAMYQICRNPLVPTEQMIVDVTTGSWISMDEANTDYQQYLAWLAEGNTPEPWNPEE